LEETGYEANDLIYLLSCYSSPGFCDEKFHLFLAKDLRKREQNLDSDEKIKVEIYSIEELKERVKRGEMEDAKSIAGILYYIAFCHEGRTSPKV